MDSLEDFDPRNALQPATIINGRLAFLGQEPVQLESFLDAAELLELNLTTGDAFNASKIKLERDRLPKQLRTEYHVAARSIVSLWIGQLIHDAKEN